MTPLSAGDIDFINAQRVAHLATLGREGDPDAVPICFACVGGAIYTPIDEKPKRVPPLALRRIRNILEHPKVCLVWDHYEEDWERLRWLQVAGEATLVENDQERARAIAALRTRYAQYERMDLESRPLIKVMPLEVRAWSGARPVPDTR